MKKIEFTEQHYAAIGKMLVMFQSLEATVTIGLLTLLQPGQYIPDSPLASAVVNELSFGSRLKLLLLYPSLPGLKIARLENGDTVFTQESFNETVALLNQAGQLVKKAEELRNGLVHSMWLAGGFGIEGAPEGAVLRTKTRLNKNKMHVIQQYMTAKDIEEVVDAISEAQSILREAVQQLNFYTIIPKI